MIISRKTTLLSLLFIFAAFTPLHAGRKTTKIITSAPEVRISREEYINRYKEIAMTHQRKFGIPASITMAQGILESDCGNSRLSRASNNHFGIKCKVDWSGRSVRHDDDAPNECFRAYSKVEESYYDHAKFLDESPRYDSLFRFDPTDYRSWARGLKGAGYATAPDYTQRLIRIIEDSKLYKLDILASGGKGRTVVTEVVAESQFTARESSSQGEVTRACEGVDPNNMRVTVNTVNGYRLYKSNLKLYIIAKEGDTYRSVAKKFSLSPSTLRGFNDEEDRGAELAPGDFVYIEQKSKSWCGASPLHTIEEGETLRSVAQLYGVKVSSLRKFNKIKDGEPSVNSLVKLRKK
ncbi:MAG: glucosaminidase domain-containing protein [Rikenellaceae bacterium]